MVNFVRTPNRFGLPDPPTWFLLRLFDLDSALVMFKSVEEPVYRLGRRVKRSPALLRVLSKHPDTKHYVDNKLVPVKSILSPSIVGMTWLRVLEQLPQYDQWKAAGTNTVEAGDKVTRLIDTQDATQMASIQKDQEAECDARSEVGYRLAKYTDGSRLGLSYRKPVGAGGAPGRGRKPRIVVPSGVNL